MRLSRIGTAAVLLVSVFGAFAAFQNCAPPVARLGNDTPPIELQSLDKLEDELNALAEADLSCSTSADCALVNVGEAPCGGWDYQLVTSKLGNQYRAVVSLAEEYTYQDKIQTRPDIVGICMLRIPEIAKCVAHSCTKELDNSVF